jgi:hypothetical protein
MTTTLAISKFFEPPKVTMAELKDLKASMSQEEWDDFGRAVAAALGVEWTPTKS